MKGDKSPLIVQDVHPLSLDQVHRARLTVLRNASRDEAGELLAMLGIGEPIKVLLVGDAVETRRWG